jgi:hypothetical protein
MGHGRMGLDPTLGQNYCNVSTHCLVMECKHFATIMGAAFSVTFYSSLLGSTTIHATVQVFSM